MDILLNDFQNFSLWLISQEYLHEVSRFILRINHQVHLNSNIINYSDLVRTKKMDLESFPTSFLRYKESKERNCRDDKGSKMGWEL